MSPTFTSVKSWRCPIVRLYCFLRLNLKTSTFFPRPLPTMVPFTVACPGPAGHQFALFLEYRPQGQLDFGADFAVQLFHADYVARGYPVLFSASLNDCVHG